jgi:hypothetical protein
MPKTYRTLAISKQGTRQIMMWSSNTLKASPGAYFEDLLKLQSRSPQVAQSASGNFNLVHFTVDVRVNLRFELAGITFMSDKNERLTHLKNLKPRKKL